MSSKPLTDSLKETLALFDRSGVPLATSEVADLLDLGRRSTYERLDRLVEHGELETKKVGASARVWWRPPLSSSGDGPTDSSSLPAAAESLIDVLNGAEVGVFVLDEDFDVAWINEATEQYFGLDREHVIGRDKRGLVKERIAPVVEDSTSFAETVLATYDDNTYTERFECRVTADKGRRARWLEHRSEPLETGRYAGGRVELYYDVTEQKRSEQTLHETEQRLQSLVDTVEEYAIFLLDPDGTVRTWNQGAKRIKGYDTDEIVGQHFSTFYTEEDRKAGTPQENLAAATKDGSTEDEGWRIRADGSRFWANVTITAIRGDDGNLEGYAKVTRDLTDRREREQTVRRERNLLDRILETSPIGIGVFHPDGSVDRVNARTADLLELTGDDVDEYTLGDVELLDPSGDPITFEESPAGQVIETGDPVTDEEVRIDHPDRGTRWISVNAAPLTDEDGRLERVITTATDITQLKEQARRLERQRDELEAELGDVFDRISDGFYGLDEDLKFTYVNDRAEALLGVEESSVIGQDIRQELFLTDQFEAALQEALEGGDPVFLEDYYEPLDAWFENTLYPSETGLSVYFRDITERKEREHELERYAGIIDAIGEPVYELDAQGRFTFVNDALVERSGYEEDELLGEHVSIGMDEEAIARVESQMADLLMDGIDGMDEVITLEYEVMTKDGERIPAENRITVLTDEDGQIDGSAGMLWDITERKQYEETLTTLYDSARALLDAESKDEVSEVIVETVTGILDLPGVVTYLYDGEKDQLYPTAQSAESGFMREEFPTLPTGDSSIAGHVYATGESHHFDDITDSPYLQTRATDMHGGSFVPMGDYGVLIVGSRAVGEFDERTQRLVELLAANAEAAYDHVERKRALEESEQRYRTLVDNFPNGAVALLDEELRYLTFGGEVPDGFDVSMDEFEGSTIYELLPEESIETLEPKYRAAFDGEANTFEIEVDGRVRHFRTFPMYDDNGDVFAIISMSQDITERVERERKLEHQRERLTALDDLNRIVRDLSEAVIDKSTREEIEQTVCEGLAASDSYQFAWIGDVDTQSQTLRLRTEAGVEGYLDDVTISVDPNDPRSAGPTGRAVQTHEIQVADDVLDDESYAPWREYASERGFRSSAAIPIVHDEILYGVLNVYADRPSAFTDDERMVIAYLGEIVGHAIAAVEQERALTSDEVVELEFQISDFFDTLNLPTSGDGRITLDRTVPVGENTYLKYGTVTDGMDDVLDALVEARPHWERVRRLDEDPVKGVTRFELLLVEPPVLSTVTALGGYVEQVVIDGGNYTMQIHMAPTTDVRRILDVVRKAYPMAQLVAQRQVTRDPDLPISFSRRFEEHLTDRQRAALESAYFAGYFEWPRDVNGQDLAESLDVSPPTFHQHLRKAQRKVFQTVLDNAI